jgi:hypothetical protein
VEYKGSHYQGKVFWSNECGRQSWRGRKGIILLPGLYAYAFLHENAVQIPAASVSLYMAGARKQQEREK